MTPRLRSAPAVAASSIACLLSIACRAPQPAAAPSIELTTIPRADAGGPAALAPIAGRVAGAQPNQRIVLFAKSGGVWWVQPFRTRPFTEIDRGATWTNSIHLGTDYAALLVDADYRPPATTESLPERGRGVAAVVQVPGSGTYVPAAPQTLTFSGYDWQVRQQSTDRHGLNEFDARNTRVDGEGRLHLLLTERDGRWTGAEVIMTRSLGYGTYSFDLRDLSQLDPSAVFSVYTWDALGADQNYRELTIDFSRWGDPRNMGGQYVVQPESVPANVFRFAIPAADVTHSFRWEPGRVAFRSVRRGGRSPGGDEAIAERLFTAQVPTAGSESVHLTLVYNRDAAKPPSGNVEVVVEKFAFLP
jgi:hypothetical protein